MATITLYKGIQYAKELSREILGFISKLTDDPTNPSLHIEPVKAARDPRVRTGRVNKQFRAVMFEVSSGKDQRFILVDVLNHDDAYKRAQKVQLKINPTSGVVELFDYDPSNDHEISQLVEKRAAELAAKWVPEQQEEQQEAEAKTPQEILAGYNVTPQALTDELGISPVTLHLLGKARSERELFHLMAVCPVWEHDAITGLLAGLSISEVREELKLVSVPTEEAEEENQLLLSLEEPVNRGSYITDPDLEVLEEILSSGDFDSWRIFLHPNQEAAVKGNHSGSARLVGGAGTGKTVVLIHRTKHLLDKNPQARVLLTTFTRKLANSLKSQMNLLDPHFNEATSHGAPGLWISGIDALVRRVLDNASPEEIKAGIQTALGIQATGEFKVLEGQAREYWEDAASMVTHNLAPEKAHPVFLAQEYSTVILSLGITTEQAYLRANRSGRGTQLGRSERKQVWATVERFLGMCALEGSYTFEMLAAIAAAVLSAREKPFFDHVLVDEAQDFHAGHWRFLRACVAQGPNDIYLAEDSHQRIYGQRMVLSRFGIQTRGRASSRLKVNYRTTKKILEMAEGILGNEEWIDSDGQQDNLDGYRSLRVGVEPIVSYAADFNEEIDNIEDTLRNWISEPGVSVGILTRTNSRCRQIEVQLSDRGFEVNTRHDANSAAHSPITVMTMNNAKGLEFTHVALLDVSSNSVPQKYLLKGLGEAELRETEQRERALLYVAASRARDQLLVSIVGEKSKFLP